MNEQQALKDVGHTHEWLIGTANKGECLSCGETKRFQPEEGFKSTGNDYRKSRLSIEDTKMAIHYAERMTWETRRQRGVK